MTKTKFNQELLDSICEEDGCSVDKTKIKFYNQKTSIEFICRCGQVCEKQFRTIYRIGGFCRKCTKKNKLEKEQKICYNEELLDSICERDRCYVDKTKIKEYNSKIKIKFTCHCGTIYEKSFERMNKNNGGFCKKCTDEKTVQIIKSVHTYTQEEFIKRAKEKHGDNYSYDNSKYINSITKIDITCPIHGNFSQLPCSHLFGRGCPKCGTISTASNTTFTQEEFIKRAKEKHGDKYSYDNSKYINSITKIDIICPIHGNFSQLPSDHLRGCGCRKCCKTYSKQQILWLDMIMKRDNIYIQHAINDKEYLIEGTRYHADGFCKDTNTIYEFHGDYWHGNPKTHKSDDVNTVCNKTYGELYKATINKENKIKELGYNLVVIWESEWEKFIKLIILIQNKFRENRIIDDMNRLCV